MIEAAAGVGGKLESRSDGTLIARPALLLPLLADG